MTIQELFEATLNMPEPESEFHGLVRGLLWSGYDRAQLIEQLLRFKDDLAKADREPAADVVFEVLSFLEGWCLPRFAL